MLILVPEFNKWSSGRHHLFLRAGTITSGVRPQSRSTPGSLRTPGLSPPPHGDAGPAPPRSLWLLVAFLCSRQEIRIGRGARLAFRRTPGIAVCPLRFGVCRPLARTWLRKKIRSWVLGDFGVRRVGAELGILPWDSAQGLSRCRRALARGE